MVIVRSGTKLTFMYIGVTDPAFQMCCLLVQMLLWKRMLWINYERTKMPTREKIISCGSFFKRAWIVYAKLPSVASKL